MTKVWNNKKVNKLLFLSPNCPLNSIKFNLHPSSKSVLYCQMCIFVLHNIFFLLHFMFNALSIFNNINLFLSKHSNGEIDGQYI